MDRQILHFTANEQELSVLDPIKISSNKVNYIEAHFDLGQNWSGYDSVRAVWFTDFNCISTVLDSQGIVAVPFEVMKRKGCAKVNLVGSISENDVLTDRLTSYPVVAFVVDCNAQITGSETSPITPSQFEQYVAAVKADADRAEDAKDSARVYAGNALSSAQNALVSETNASTSETNAHTSEVNAKASEDNAKISELSASASATEAEEWADKAEQSAEDAGYMEFHIDEDGHLIYEHTSNVDDIDFELINGHLILEVA